MATTIALPVHDFTTFGDRDGALQSLVTTADLAGTSGECALEVGTYARQNLTHALLGSWRAPCSKPRG